MRRIALSFIACVFATAALAADMPKKAPNYFQPLPPVTCTVTSCTGWFIGGNLMNTGTSLNVLGTGLTGIAQNGIGLGAQAGYEYFNNNIYAAAYVVADYDVSLQSPASVSDRFTLGGGVRLGYSLASQFGAATTGVQTPTLPQQFLQSLMTPYILAEEVKRHGQPAIGAGGGLEALLAADATGHSSWTINAELINYTYNQGGTSGTLVASSTTQNNETVVRASLTKHFGF